MEKLSCVILEDEDDIRSWLIRKLNTFPEIDIIGDSASIDDAYVKLKQLKPDVAFMDIQLIGGDVFTLIEQLIKENVPIPLVVLTTGYPDYFLNDQNDYDKYVVHFLLKPFADDWREKFSQAIKALTTEYTKRLT